MPHGRARSMIRLFQVSIPTTVLLLLFAEVILAFACFFVPVWSQLPNEPEIYLLYEGGLVRVLIAVATLILGVYFQDLYDDFRVTSPSFLFAQFCTAAGVVIVVQAAVGYMSQDYVLPGWIALAGAGAALLVLP